MPVMDGYSATGNIREWERENRREPVPIIALTAYALKDDVQKSLDAGCNVHLSKPVKKSELLKTILEYTGGPETRPADGKTRREEKILVQADPDIADMIPWYLGKVEEDVNAMNEALGNSDFETIRVTGHRMKGSGANYGFDGISNLGKKLERSAKEGNTKAIKQFLENLSSYMGRIEVNYEQEPSSEPQKGSV